MPGPGTYYADSDYNVLIDSDNGTNYTEYFNVRKGSSSGPYIFRVVEGGASGAGALVFTYGSIERSTTISLVTDSASTGVKWIEGSNGYAKAQFILHGVGYFTDSNNTAATGLVIQVASSPPTGEEGMLYLNSSTNELNLYTAGAWRSMPL